MPVDLLLAQYVARPDSVDAVLNSIVSASARFRPAGTQNAERADLLAMRMRSRDPRIQMPPLGTQSPDLLSLSLIERWTSHDLKTPKEQKR